MRSESNQLSSIEETLRTKYWHWEIHEPLEKECSLESFLRQHLPHISPESWPERYDFGGIYINGIRCPLQTTLYPPCKIEYYEPKFSIGDAHTIFPPFHSRYILYEDGLIAVVYKPAGLSSMPAKEQHNFSLKSAVERELKKTIHMPSRLDVSAQGIVVVSTAPKMHAKLQQLFEERKVTKEYLCASLIVPSWQTQRVTLPISRDPKHPVLRTTTARGGQPAETHFALLNTSEGASGLQANLLARPITGRTHQIRVHASSIGVPLLGDRFYCGGTAEHLHLVSHSVSFYHPENHTPFTYTVSKDLLPSWAKACQP